MKDKLIEQAKALAAALKEQEEANPAAWKARIKVESAIRLLSEDWPAPTRNAERGTRN